MTYEPFIGHGACAGCGGALAVRTALKTVGERAVAVLPAGCMSAVGFNFPQLCFTCNAIISTFAGTASMMTGVAAGLRARGETGFKVVGFAGDGGTADIGIQALSGAISRGDDMLYICYDNEGYMNTGTQSSSLTPHGARTTTSPAMGASRGNPHWKKDMLEIVAAHGIPYAATASVGYLKDYVRKVERAASVGGPAYIQVLAPCPTGWGADPSETVELAREAVDCGLWPLAEFDGGGMRLTMEPRDPSLLASHLRRQGRFAHLSDEDIREIGERRDRRLERIRGKKEE